MTGLDLRGSRSQRAGGRILLSRLARLAISYWIRDDGALMCPRLRDALIFANTADHQISAGTGRCVCGRSGRAEGGGGGSGLNLFERADRRLPFAGSRQRAAGTNGARYDYPRYRQRRGEHWRGSARVGPLGRLNELCGHQADIELYCGDLHLSVMVSNTASRVAQHYPLHYEVPQAPL